MGRILLTGVTGNVGKAVLASLPQDTDLIVGVRRIGQIPNSKEVQFDFELPETFPSALEGVKVIFLLRPPQLSDVTVFSPLIEACEATAVKHVVFLSVQGADKQTFIPHYKIEQMLLKSKLNCTFLRPAYFMENFTTTLQQDLIKRNEIYLPAGQARFALISVQDVGKVASKILLHPEAYINRAIELTNGELLNFKEMAGQLSAVLQRRIRYVSPNLIQFFLRKKKEGVQTSFILVMILLHYLPRFQSLPNLSNAVHEITGELPLSFHEFVQKNHKALI